MAKVSMPPLDIQRLKLANIIVASPSPNNKCNYMVFVTIVSNNLSTKGTQERKSTQEHWHKINLYNQIFSQMKRGMYLL
jgi:hypothetical protein